MTFVSTLVPIGFENQTQAPDEIDILLGVGHGNPATYRVYIDKSVTPYALSVDPRFLRGGSMLKYARIFLGGVTSDAGTTISRVYDAGMNFVSDMVQLENVALNNHTNTAIKAVPPCRTISDLPDGELVTVVIYNDNGHVMDKQRMLVENTSFIRHTSHPERYITGISLKSMFLSDTQIDTLEYPLNLPLNSLNLLGIVHYSDGSKSDPMPVDGTKFTIYGLDQYVSTIIGQPVDLVLCYNLSPDEVSFAEGQTYNRAITRPYKLLTVNSNNSYAVKLYAYPVWNEPTNKYQLRFHMLNLDRNIMADVTGLVSFNEGFAFRGDNYGIVQTLSVNIDLSDVSSQYRSFIHTQQMEVVLYGPPQAMITQHWEVSHEKLSGRPFYGTLLKARRVGLTAINIASDITVEQEWLDRVYYATYPLYNIGAESRPLVPSHFRIYYKSKIVDYPIDQWGLNLNLDTVIDDNTNVRIVFLNKDVGDDKILSVAEMLIKD
jgi:hypothetical protein